MRNLSLTTAMLGLVLWGVVDAAPSAIAPSSPVSPGAQVLFGAAHSEGWIVEKDDFISGISDPKKLSNPGQLDYDECLDVTAPMKELKRRNIDPESTAGKALRNRARTLVTKASELVRKSKGHCSIWKVIRHSDGRIVPDVTDDVKERL